MAREKGFSTQNGWSFSGQFYAATIVDLRQLRNRLGAGLEMGEMGARPSVVDCHANGSTVDVPVYIRDTPGTLLNRTGSGPKIQSFAVKVLYSPAAAVSSVAFARSGITTSLSPTAQFNPTDAHSV